MQKHNYIYSNPQRNNTSKIGTLIHSSLTNGLYKIIFNHRHTYTHKYTLLCIHRHTLAQTHEGRRADPYPCA